MRRATRAIRPDLILVVYVVAFSVGTMTHVADILRWGILPRNQYHVAFNMFWSSLTLDPLAIVLLLRRQRSGVLLGGPIMVLDVTVNVAAGLHEYFATGRFLMWGLFTQIPFALFLLATAPSLWSAFVREGAPASAASLRSPARPAPGRRR